MASSNVEFAKVAIKLVPDAVAKQEAEADFVLTLIQKADPTFLDGLKGDASLLITTQPANDLAARVQLATSLDPNYTPTNFSAWFKAGFTPENDEAAKKIQVVDYIASQAIVQLVQKLVALPEVESAHLLQRYPPPAVRPEDDPQSGKQEYLNPAPRGIDARYAWTMNGGDGKSANVVDLETGWLLTHEDLVGYPYPLILTIRSTEMESSLTLMTRLTLASP
jgi:serine protease